MTLLFVHGWGFDADIWRDVAALLEDFPQAFAERGYFGAARDPEVNGPVIAVAHSFGAMRVLRDPPRRCRGLIAVNGFDCFTARGDFPGVAPRVVDRMIMRFDHAPETVLGDFRRRCGAGPPPSVFHTPPLRHDLLALRDMDCREDSARWTAPMLSLQAAGDPILSPGMHEKVFAAAPHVARATGQTAGHLLPLTDAVYCARAIRQFVEKAA